MRAFRWALACFVLAACRDVASTATGNGGTGTPVAPAPPPPPASTPSAASAASSANVAAAPADAGPRPESAGCEIERDCDSAIARCPNGGKALCVRPWQSNADGAPAVHMLGMCQVTCAGGATPRPR